MKVHEIYAVSPSPQKDVKSFWGPQPGLASHFVQGYDFTANILSSGQTKLLKQFAATLLLKPKFYRRLENVLLLKNALRKVFHQNKCEVFLGTPA